MRQPDGVQTDAGHEGWARSPEPACGTACGRRDATPIADDSLAGKPGLTSGLVTRLRWAWESQ
jgi:hypothetical protein